MTGNTLKKLQKSAAELDDIYLDTAMSQADLNDAKKIITDAINAIYKAVSETSIADVKK